MHLSLFKETYFYPMAILLFFVDIFCFSFMEKQLLYSVLCFFCIEIYRENSWTRFGFLGFLISLESLLYFGKFGVQFFYLTPIILIGLQAQKMFYARALQPYFILIGCIVLQCLFLEPFLLQTGSSALYTVSKIIANIIMLWFISLIDTSQGNLSNRFDPFTWFKEESPDS